MTGSTDGQAIRAEGLGTPVPHPPLPPSPLPPVPPTPAQALLTIFAPAYVSLFFMLWWLAYPFLRKGWGYVSPHIERCFAPCTSVVHERLVAANSLRIAQSHGSVYHHTGGSGGGGVERGVERLGEGGREGGVAQSLLSRTAACTTTQAGPGGRRADGRAKDACN